MNSACTRPYKHFFFFFRPAHGLTTNSYNSSFGLRTALQFFFSCYLGLAIQDWLKRHDNEEPCFWNSPWHTRRIEIISEVTQQLADRQPKVLAKGGQRALEVVVAYIVFSSLGAVRFAHVWSLLRLPHHPPFTHPPTYRHRFTRGKTYDWVGANAEHF